MSDAPRTPSALSLAKAEFARLGSGLQRAGLAFLLLVPTLLAAVYLWANWDPLGQLDELPFALVDQDQPTQAAGQSVAGGTAVTEWLTTEPLLGWEKVDAVRAEQGLKDGDFFGVLTIPPDFSARLASPAGDDPERASVSLRFNDANNYLAGVAASGLGVDLQDQIDAAAQQAYADATFAGYDLLTKGYRVAADEAGALAERSGGTRRQADELSASLGELERSARDAKSAAQDHEASIDGLAKGLQDSSDAVRAATDKLKDVVNGNAGAAGTTPATTPDDEDDEGESAAKPDSGGEQGALDAAAAGLEAAAGKARDNVDDIDKSAAAVSDETAAVRAAAGTANDDGEAVAEATGEVASDAQDLADSLQASTEDLPSGTDDSREELASVLVHPVTVNVSTDNAAGTYGRGMAPLFLSIGLWTFALLVFLLLRPAAEDEYRGEASSLNLVLGGWLPAAALGAGSAVVLFVVGLALGLDPGSPLAALSLLVLASAAFTAVVQALRLAFGVAGLAVALVLLVLQLAASGGVYPVELAPGALRVISPVLPFTPLIEALRVVISGGVAANVGVAAAVLAVLLAAGVAVSTAVVSRRRKHVVPSVPVPA